MQLSQAIGIIEGLRFMTGRLELSSPLCRAKLYDLPWLDSPQEINAALDEIASMLEVLGQKENAATVERLRTRLGQVKDIRGTAGRLASGAALDDIELFEVKAFALLAAELGQTASNLGITFVAFPDLERVVKILDPDGMRIPHFYVYESYDQQLAQIRHKIKTAPPEQAEQLRQQHDELEDHVRATLSATLRPFAQNISDALEATAHLDLVLAKARQAKVMDLARPQLSDETTTCEGLFNPPVADALERTGRRFQPVDVELPTGPTLITGTNMGGKTVVLGSVGLAQALCQFGFYVPARRAAIVPVQGIVALAADTTPVGGLSSFASEMARLAAMTAKVNAGANLLVLIDEPARGTNPVEGRAIAAAIVDFLSRNHTRSLVTTHYGNICDGCRKLRVKGFSQEYNQEDNGAMTLDNIEKYMDYSLMPDDGSHPPREALRIARLSGVDSGILDYAKRILEK